MRTRLIILLILLPAIPLIGLGWLGVSTYRNEKALMAHRQDALYLDRLQDMDRVLSRRIKTYEQHLRSVLDDLPAHPADIREVVQTERLVLTLFRLDKEGRLRFPSGDALTTDEVAFLKRTERIWTGKDMFLSPEESPDSKPSRRCDWFTWHMDDGLRLLYRCADTNGDIVGAELDPMAVTADIIAELPDTVPETSDGAAGFQVRLVDVDGTVVYPFGSYSPPKTANPSVTLNLSPPLASFHLAYFSKPEKSVSLFAGSVAIGLILGFTALVLVVVGLGVTFVRENSRDARTARERMTFVNQVSHELKTPLTNLRMYAELLEEYLEEDDERGQRYVKVIVAESERLSRLIANVLSFARSARGKLSIRRTLQSPDQVVRETVERFAPVFAEADIAMETSLDAAEPRHIDGDALAQILSNLLGNVEKYAAQGKWVSVESTLDADRLTVTVRDAGGGIPVESRGKIFEPFVRLSNKLTDRAAGTGIGLAISRELARRHGGDITVLDTDTGAAFAVTLNAPKTQKEMT